MEPHEWDELETYFLECENLSGETRTHFLATLERSKPELAKQLKLMLQHQNQADSFFENTPGQLARPDQSIVEEHDQSAAMPVVKPYRLEKHLSSGGMGEVFLAHQESPVKRPVALKLLRAACNTPEHMERFFAEKDILARMNHPSIAKLFDFGFSQDGRPYFSMELIEGLPLDEFCDTYQLGLNQRLQLFLKVCDGMLHAHQKMIIHRDLKPSNILASMHQQQPSVKIIDFGISKNLDAQNVSAQNLTRLDSYMGTIPYLSPEQAKGSSSHTDTRSDIYSLGIVAYVLLTGSWPFNQKKLESAVLDQQLQTVRETPPQLPSKSLQKNKSWLAKLSENSDKKQQQLLKSFRTDLDWILMRALEKDPERRFPSVNALKDDIQAFLSRMPIQSRPPSLNYRFRKWFHRNRLLAIPTILVTIAMLLAGGLTVINTLRTNNQIRFTQQKQKEAYDYLAKMITRGSGFQGGKDATLPDLIDKSLQEIDQDLRDDPIVRSFIKSIYGNFYLSYGEFKIAEELFEDVYAIREHHLGSDNHYTWDAQERMANLQFQIGNYQKANDLFLELAARYEHQDLEQSLAMGKVYLGLGKVNRQQEEDKAQDYLKRALAIFQAEKTLDNDFAVVTMLELGTFAKNKETYQEAMTWLNRAHKLSLNTFGTKGLNTLLIKGLRGEVSFRMASQQPKQWRDLRRQGLVLMREACTALAQMIGPENPTTAEMQKSYADSLRRAGYYQDSDRIISKASLVLRNKYGAQSEYSMSAELILASTYYYRGCAQDALRILKQIPSALNQSTTSKNRTPHIVNNNIGNYLFITDDYTEAQWYAEESLFQKLDSDTSKAKTKLISFATLAEIRLAQRLYDDALMLIENALQLATHNGHADENIGYLLQGLHALCQIGLKQNQKQALNTFNSAMDKITQTSNKQTLLKLKSLLDLHQNIYSPQTNTRAND